jgi:hypothetical protein
MRLNSYVSGLGELGYFVDTADYDWQAITDSAGFSSGIPSTGNQSASGSWSNLLQNVIKTGVNVGSQIALTQHAVPQLAPGTTYSYNAKSGSYLMTSATPGQASVISTGAGSFLTSPIFLLAAGGLAIALFLKKR